MMRRHVSGFLRASPISAWIRGEGNYIGAYGRSAGHLRLGKLALPDFSGNVEQVAFFSCARRCSGNLPCSGQPRLFEPKPNLEIARNLFET
jgi:hypothetical protein